MQNHFVSNTTKTFTVLETHIEHSPKYIRHSIISKKYNMNTVEYFVAITDLERLKFYFLNE